MEPRTATHPSVAWRPEIPSRAVPVVRSSDKVVAFDLLNAESRAVSERRLFALVDAAACVLDHGDDYGGLEVARLVLEVVAAPDVALAAVRAMTGEIR